MVNLRHFAGRLPAMATYGHVERLQLGDLDRRNVEGMALENLPLQDRFGFRTAGLLACEYFQDGVHTLCESEQETR